MDYNSTGPAIASIPSHMEVMYACMALLIFSYYAQLSGQTEGISILEPSHVPVKGR